jgi:hypothetical protein
MSVGIGTPWKALERLRRDQRGATLPIMVVGLIAMIASVGSAIDIARVYITTSQMQAGADAAALAGANAFDNDDEEDPNGRYKQVIAYFKDNFPDGYMGVQRAPDVTPIDTTQALLEPEFTLANGISRTVVTASADLPMTFMHLFGMGPQRISVEAHAEFQPRPLEVMLVLDNTGSLQKPIGSTTKIEALKTAVRGFINVLYQGGQEAQPNLALGVINYTNQVNVGSLLRSASIGIEEIPGFTDVPWTASGGMAWKGCVANDETVNTALNTGSLTVEAGAFDLTNTLPGETPPGGTKPMANIRPMLMPPLWRPKSNTKTTYQAPTLNALTGYYAPNNSDTNNLYGGAWTGAVNAGNAAAAAAANKPGVQTLANNPAFKRFFYRYYIGMNNGAANNADDVITEVGGGYYDPESTGSFDPLTNTGRSFDIRVDKIPNLPFFKPTTAYVTTSNTTAMPSPNWQCPQPGLPITYNVVRKTYDDFINNQVWAILPANGTMHHTGFIWGWRILSRYDKFIRNKPAGSGHPVRALVFMTDGKSELGNWDTTRSETNKDGVTTHYVSSNDKNFTGYGSVNDRTITKKVDDNGAIRSAADDRFEKACAIANSHVFEDSKKTVQTYVVAINVGADIDPNSKKMLRGCGKDGYYLSETPDDLNAAFAQIARTLVDVHLTK